MHSETRGAHSQPQEKPLGAVAVGLTRQAGIELLSQQIEQHGILARLLRKDSLGQARHEHDVEIAASRLRGRRNEHAPVAPIRRTILEHGQPLDQHLPNFIEIDGTNLRERPEVGKHLEHPIGSTEDLRRKGFEMRQPLPPRRGVRPEGHGVDDRKGKASQPRQGFDVSLDRADTG